MIHLSRISQVCDSGNVGSNVIKDCNPFLIGLQVDDLAFVISLRGS